MTADLDRLLKLRARTLKATLRDAPLSQKQGHAAVATTDLFNTLRADVVAAHPELDAALPARIAARGPARHHGISDLSFLDVEIMVDQVIALLDSLGHE